MKITDALVTAIREELLASGQHISQTRVYAILERDEVQAELDRACREQRRAEAIRGDDPTDERGDRIGCCDLTSWLWTRTSLMGDNRVGRKRATERDGRQNGRVSVTTENDQRPPLTAAEMVDKLLEMGIDREQAGRMARDPRFRGVRSHDGFYPSAGYAPDPALTADLAALRDVLPILEGSGSRTTTIDVSMLRRLYDAVTERGDR